MSQQDKVGKHATTVFISKSGTYIKVRYHDTNVVTVDDGTITLNTGGWFTATTKTRMNQASNQFNLGYNVYQDDGKWYVVYQNKARAFKSNKVVLMPDGTIVN